MISFEEMHEKNLIKVGMKFDKIDFYKNIIRENFFTIIEIKKDSYRGFHEDIETNYGLIWKQEILLFWLGKLRLSKPSYKKFQFENQLNDL